MSDWIPPETGGSFVALPVSAVRDAAHATLTNIDQHRTELHAQAIEAAQSGWFGKRSKERAERLYRQTRLHRANSNCYSEHYSAAAQLYALTTAALRLQADDEMMVTVADFRMIGSAWLKLHEPASTSNKE
jgi:hypothetical protein